MTPDIPAIRLFGPAALDASDTFQKVFTGRGGSLWALRLVSAHNTGNSAATLTIALRTAAQSSQTVGSSHTLFKKSVASGASELLQFDDLALEVDDTLHLSASATDLILTVWAAFHPTRGKSVGEE